MTKLAPHAPPSPAQELKAAIVDGRAVRRGRGGPATGGRKWGKDRLLDADVLYELLVGAAHESARRAVVLVGLRITGRVNLEAAELQVPLIMHNCYFDHPINLRGASAPEIELRSCVVPGVDAADLHTRRGFCLPDSTLGVLSLPGARIKGQLDLCGATFTGGNHPLDLGEGTLHPPESAEGPTTVVAIFAEGLVVEQDVYCNMSDTKRLFTAEGEVRLWGARIGGVFDLIGARLINPRGIALYADGLDVGQDMNCCADENEHCFVAEGEVRLGGARVGGVLNFSSGQLSNASGPALNADGLSVGRDMFCNAGFGGEHFNATGGVSLIDARIGANLDFGEATLTSERGLALDAVRVRVGDNLVCSAGTSGRFVAHGGVRLRGARIGGDVVFDGAQLSSASLPALDVEASEIARSLFCRVGNDEQPFTADGEVAMFNARIGGTVAFDGAQLSGADVAVNADRLNAGEGSFSGWGPDLPLRASGEIRLVAACIAGRLSFVGAELESDEEVTLNAESLDTRILVLRDLKIRGPSDEQGRGLSLVAARIGDLAVDKEGAAGAFPGPLDATGWEVGNVHDALRTDSRAAAEWLGSQEPFSAQPWHALAAVYERNGQPAEARRLRFQAAHRTTRSASWWSKPPRWAYGALVGYGYYPLAAGAWLVAALVAAFLVTVTHTSTFVPNLPSQASVPVTPLSSSSTAPPPAAVSGATDCDALAGRYPCLRPSLYALDVVLPPTVTTGQNVAWRPGVDWIAYLLTFLRTLGWLLTALLIAGVTGLLRKT
jgi:hypothetical protein